MELIGTAFDALGRLILDAMPPGDLRSLIVDGALAGVAGVVTFLPQIAFLFFFLGLLEDSGYMARAAFIMDKLMSKVGLHGKSFIPLLGSFACAVPGIMATRTIENPKDRLATILVAPLMSCSARLPVYSLLIAACIPPTVLLGVVSYQGLTLLVTLCDRHGDGTLHGMAVQENTLARCATPLHHGTPAVQDPVYENRLVSGLGTGTGISQDCGNHHPRGLDSSLVSCNFSQE